MKIAETWSILEQGTSVTNLSGRLQRRIMPEGQRNLFLGLEMPSGNRMLIIRVATGSLPEQQSLPASHGVTVRIERQSDQSGEAEVEVILTDAQHQDIFDLLVRDLIEATEQPQNERAGISRMLSRLSDWQQLLQRLSARGLSSEQQRGLWGELWFLKTVIAPVLGLSEAIRSWTGPMGTDQDFQLGTVCIEVKTSTAHILDRVPISSERQLETPDDVALVLVGLSLDARLEHGTTLSSLVRKIREDADGIGCSALLDSRLEQYGYHVADASLYEVNGYSVRSFEPFRVGPEFPKLTSCNLPTGLNDIRYRVSLASCQAHRMKRDNLVELLRSTHDCPALT